MRQGLEEETPLVAEGAVEALARDTHAGQQLRRRGAFVAMAGEQLDRCAQRLFGVDLTGLAIRLPRTLA